MNIPFSTYINTERVRGFQPPWYTVLIYKCNSCGQKHRIKKNWKGPLPVGAFDCACDERKDLP